MSMRKGKINLADLWRHLAFVGLEVLRDNGGQMLMHDVLSGVAKRAGRKIPESEKSSSEWRRQVHNSSFLFARMGALKTRGGVWRLTAKGEALVERGEEAAVREARLLFQDMRKPKAHNLPPVDSATSDSDTSEGASLAYEADAAQAKAAEGIKSYILRVSFGKFEELCAALLRGMGYYVVEARDGPKKPTRPDGGVDVHAYSDPLGAPPRIKVQAKHRTGGAKVSVDEVRKLAGVLREGDIGVFITSSDFTSDCFGEAHANPKHLELIDLLRFIELWRQHYNKMSEEDKSLLPLQAIYFLDEKRARGDS